MKKYIVKFYIIACFMLSSFNLLAQPGDTDGTPTDNLEGTDPVASINSYLVLLLVIGINLGIIAIRKKVKIKNGSCSIS